MKPVIMSVDCGSSGMTRAVLACDTSQRTAGPERTPIHRDDVARIDPAHRTRTPRALLEIHREQSRRPDLAIPGDQVAHRLRGRTNQADGLQDAGDITAVAIELRHVLRAVAGIEQRVGDDAMTFAQLIDARLDDVFLSFGSSHQIEQRIGHATACR